MLMKTRELLMAEPKMALWKQLTAIVGAMVAVNVAMTQIYGPSILSRNEVVTEKSLEIRMGPLKADVEDTRESIDDLVTHRHLDLKLKPLARGIEDTRSEVRDLGKEFREGLDGLSAEFRGVSEEVIRLKAAVKDGN